MSFWKMVSIWVNGKSGQRMAQVDWSCIWGIFELMMIIASPKCYWPCTLPNKNKAFSVGLVAKVQRQMNFLRSINVFLRYKIYLLQRSTKQVQISISFQLNANRNTKYQPTKDEQIIITSHISIKSYKQKGKQRMKKQRMSQSHMISPSFQNPKQSRLFAKQQQIKRKVSRIQTREQLQKIYKTMKNQNLQLVKDVTVLKQHLAQVEDKKKMQASRISSKVQSSVSAIINNSDMDLSQQNPKLAAEYQAQKKQLDQQYELMDYLKQTVLRLQKETETEDVKEQKINKLNKVKQIENEIFSQRKKAKLLLKEGEQLEMTMEQNIAGEQVNMDSVLFYEQENADIRKKISLFKQKDHTQDYKAASVIDQIYKKKQILTQYLQKPKKNTLLTAKHPTQLTPNSTFFKRTKSLSNNISHQHQQPTPNEPINDTQLTSEITSLKNQVHQLSVEELKRKQQQKKHKEELIQATKIINDKFKELEKVKTKKVVELNHLKAKVQIIIREKQLKQKNKIITINFGIQQNGFNCDDIAEPLRRDFAGVIGMKVRFDDRMFLREKKRTFIKGIIVYENDNNLSVKGSIVGLRAIYTDQQTNQKNNIPIPGQYLQKCKMQRLQLPEDDFIKLIKVKYNNLETRVSKIEIRSNRNLKYEFGEKKSFQDVTQNQSVYAFDIGLNEFPVGMFGSFCQFRNCWYLESFGVEINTLT